MEDKAYTHIFYDIYNKVLQLSENPSQFAEYLTLQIRELIGTRTVVIALKTETGQTEIFSVFPQRRKDWASQSEVIKLAEHSFKNKTIQYLDKEKCDNDCSGLLNHLEIEKIIAIPLIVGTQNIGSILLLDILDEFGIESVINLLDELSGVFALVIRNAYLYHEMENLVSVRTKELQNQNWKLLRSEQELQALNEEYQVINEELIDNINKADQINKELVEANRRAEKSELQAREILQTAMDGFLLINLDGRFKDVNEVACKMLGYKREEMIAMSISDIEYIETGADVKQRIKKIQTTGKDRFETKHRCKNGNIIDVEVSVVMQSSQNQLVVFVHDITNRKLAEKALKESNERFQLAMMASNDGLFDWNLETNEIYYSPGWKKMLGYEDHELPNDFSIWENLTKPEDVQKSWELQQKLISRQIDRFVLEFKMKHKDGHWVDILSRAEAFFNDEGKAIRIVGTHTDLSERKKAENALRKSEAIQSKMVANIGDVIVIVDSEGINRYKSINIEKWFGWKPEELVGKSTWDVVHPEDLNYAQQVFNTLLKEKDNTTNLEFRYQCKDGSYKWIEFTGVNLVHDKDINGILGNYHDISERKKNSLDLVQAKEKAEESEEKYRLLHENAGIGIGYYKVDGTIISYNTIAARIMNGVPEDFKGKSIYDFFPRSVAEFYLERIKKAAVSEFPVTYEDEVNLPAGNNYFLSTYARIINTAGEIEGIQIMSHDITEQKTIAKKLQQSQTLLSEAEILTDIGSWEWDVNQDIAYWSDGMFRIFKRSPKEGAPNWKQHSPFYVKEDFEAYSIVVDECIKNGTSYQFELRAICSDGEIKHCIARGTADRNPEQKIVRLWGTLQDITAIRLKESALRESEEMMRNSQSVAHICSYSTNLKVDDIAKSSWVCSPEFYQIFGIDKTYPHTIEGWAAFIHPDYREELVAYHEYVIKEKIHFEHEYKIIRINDGVERWVYGTGKLEFDEKGNPIRMHGAIQDITERKQNEIEILKAKEKAEESDRLKSAFLANMSHEIRTPMNGILGFTELLREPDLTSEQKETYINIVHQSGQRMLNTVNDIVEISKIEAGIVTVNLNEVDVQLRLDELMQFFTPEATKKGLKLIMEREVPKKVTVISTDQNKIDSIFTNLLKNAIKFTPSGEIIVGCKVHEKNLEFYVKDTGIGIPAERQHAVFDRFTKADILDKDANQGSGLGLAITKAYVEMLGGKIWVESEEGIGSTFYFTLPRIAEAHEKDTDKNGIQAIEAGNLVKNLKILIAEDDETSGQLISIYLQKSGNEIISVKTGRDAVEACRDNPDIDLILMDIQMPEMNGYEATRQIRQFNNKVIIIALTAFALAGDREKALDAGCNDYITKPVKKDQLQKLIKKYFDYLKS